MMPFSSNNAQLSTAKPLPRDVKLLGWASFLNDVASEMVYPLLPQFLITVLGGNRFHLGIIEGVADSTASLVKLWSGARSDRVGSRKGFVVIGYAVAAIARPVIGVLVAPWQLFAARVGDRIGKGIRTSPRDAMIADCTEANMRGRAFGFQRGMDHLGAAVGPLLAASFLWYWAGQLRVLCLLTLIPGLLVVVLLAIGLRTANVKSRHLRVKNGRPEGVDSGPSPSSQLTLKPFHYSFRLYLVTLAVFTLGNSADAFLLVRASELGVTTPLLPILWCVFHMVKSAGSMIAGRFVDRCGPQPMILGGWFVYALVYLAFAVATSSWQMWVLFPAYAVFYALTEPAEKTFVANLVGVEHRGLAYGWFNFAVGVSALPSSLVFGLLYERFGSLIAFGWGASMALLAGLLLTTVKPRPEQA